MGRFDKLLSLHTEDQESVGDDAQLNGNDRKRSKDRFLVSRSQILRDPGQIRKYFDPDKLSSLAQTILEEGILEDLAVFELSDKPGYYQLIFGERRFRASEIAGLNKLPVRVLEKPDTKRLLKIQLIENKHHEDLNPIEEVEAVLELLSEELGHPEELVISLLKQMDNDARRSSYNVIGQPESDKIIQLLEGLNIKWRSFVLNQLQLLKLPQDILDLIRKGQIEYTKALAIAKVKDERKRRKLVKDVIEKDLSIREIRSRVKELNQVEEPDNDRAVFKQRWALVTKHLSNSESWIDSKKKKKLETLMSQLESLFEI
jgi:ParB family transcriptional regulator, chromosome partitioning protein